MFDEYIGKIIIFGDEPAFHRWDLCVSGSPTLQMVPVVG